MLLTVDLLFTSNESGRTVRIEEGVIGVLLDSLSVLDDGCLQFPLSKEGITLKL